MKPKVLLDISMLGHDPSVRRGVERVVCHLFEGLRRSGQVEMSFIASSHLAGAWNFLQSEGIAPETHLRFRRHQLRLSRAGLKLSKHINRSIEDRSFPARARRWALAKVAQSCTRGEIRFAPWMLQGADIYHSPFTPYPRVVHRQPGLVKFITVHDLNPIRTPHLYHPSDAGYMAGLKACLAPSHFAFCVSEATRNEVLNITAIPPEHVFVTPLAADKTYFYLESDPDKLKAVRVKYGIPDGNYFLSLSAHAPHKNFPHLIHCFAALVESGELTNTSLVIAGPNPQRNPAARATIEKYPRLQSRVILAGRIPDEDMAALYSGATAFLFPSFGEGFGIPTLEAMQCGTPVVSSNTTSMPEVIGDAGILLPPTDVDAWCQAMLQMSRQPALRKELSEKSLQRSKLFSWQRFLDQTVHGYRTSLEMQPPR